jgi:hypothetical protein
MEKRKPDPKPHGENPKTEEQLNNRDCNTDEMLSKQTINPCIGSAKLEQFCKP